MKWGGIVGLAGNFMVALFTRAWIEIQNYHIDYTYGVVALFTRAWIEIVAKIGKDFGTKRRPLHEGVD